MMDEVMAVNWCKPTTRRLTISATVTVLLIARPIALSTIVRSGFSGCVSKVRA